MAYLFNDQAAETVSDENDFRQSCVLSNHPVSHLYSTIFPSSTFSPQQNVPLQGYEVLPTICGLLSISNKFNMVFA